MKPLAQNVHDIGVRASISRTVIAEGVNTTVTINVTVINYGEHSETFNLTFQVGSTIENQTLTLLRRNSLTQTFTWKTAGASIGKYTVTTYAHQVPDEADTTDNTFNHWIAIVIPGDIDGDGHVFLYDCTILGTAYGSRPGDPNWNANADIDGDSHVFLYDLTILGSHWDEYG
jgi:hypothetical protein